MTSGYGFVGTGAITAAVVTGLGADGPDVFLSPRNREVGQRLAGRFPNVRVCAANQDVLDRADVVVLAVRPQIARTVLAELAFRPQHVVLSALAGIRLEQLREWVAPAGAVVRAIPLPAAADRRSLTVMYPDNAVARGLFGRVGGVLVPDAEPTLEVFSAATSTFAAHVDYLATIAGWLAEHGVADDAAAAYTMHVFGLLGRSLLEQPGSFAELTDRYMTPGGLNEQLRTDLRDDGVPDLVRQALDRVLARVRGTAG
jgi:pyrroline-5-carboxylate reductase